MKPALFGAILGNDLSAGKNAELAAIQRPIAASTLADVSGSTGLNSHSQLGRHRHRRPRRHPAAQKFMAQRAQAHVTTIPASHLSLISQPGKVSNVIEEAARLTSLPNWMVRRLASRSTPRHQPSLYSGSP